MSKSNQPLEIIQSCHSTPTVSCSQCRLASICLPISLHVEDVDKVDGIIQRGRPLQKGDYLYRARDTFHSVYAVRSGTVKTYTSTNDGKEQVTGFYLPGEILGLDGVARSTHTNSAVALETSAICEIPFNKLDDLGSHIPNLHRHMYRLLGREIGTDQQLITLLSKSSADERVATLLLSISSRNGRRNLSVTSFRLPMSRADLGNYLGLTVETVSRTLSRFQKQGLIRADKKEITITDIEALRKIGDISLFETD
ncbi:fumarate/nitrate reduction transcriptional regulator Fnr [Gilvimarinus sp. F26214L]|uniref:fumarate/nitrate reduction transcriptional regulator Fnr n=1 Tax=Gilvimarinus sp. DZF01 TaxID=3461371 RepID=UPI0040464650